MTRPDFGLVPPLSLIATFLGVPAPARAQCHGPYELRAPDAALNDSGGAAVAIDGDFAIVGASLDDITRTDQGSASIYRFENSAWVFQTRLLAPAPVTRQQFGAAVDISGDTAVVGYGAFGGLFPAFVFVRNPATGAWPLQAQVFANPALSLEQFSSAVALDGDTLVVGAPLHTSSAGTSQGAAYVFVRSGSTWTQQAKLIPADPAAFAEFGTAVDISGNSVIVGSPGDVSRAAYIFVRSGTTWSQQGKLTAGKTAPNIGFARRIAIDADTAVVGASLFDGPAGADQGAAFVYQRTGTLWTLPTILTPSDAAAGMRFGASVAISNNTILVGRSVADESISPLPRGAAWLFERNGAQWDKAVRIENLASNAWDRFGHACALDGDTAFVGASFALTSPGALRTGDARSFHRAGGRWTLRAPGDADLDGRVVFTDVRTVLLFWGADYRPGTGPGDSNSDGVVNGDDIGAVTGNWLVDCR